MMTKYYQSNLLDVLEAYIERGVNITLVFDKDGVVVDFVDCDEVNPGWREKCQAPGYYRGLPQITEGVDFIREAIRRLGAERVFSCTAAPTAHAMEEKVEWDAEHIPEMLPENIIPVFIGENKAEKMYKILPQRGFDPTLAILLDDYGHNLKQWYEMWVQHGGNTAIAHPAVKAYNGHNCKGGKARKQACPVLHLRNADKADADWRAHVANGLV